MNSSTLEVGDHVLVSIAKGFRSEWSGVAWKVIEELRLTPLVYYGLDSVAPLQTTSIHKEATRDLYVAEVVVAVIADDIAVPSADWILPELDRCIQREIPVICYIWSESQRHGYGELPVVVQVHGKVVANVEGFEQSLRKDLRQLMLEE